MNELLRTELERYYWNNENPIEAEEHENYRERFYKVYDVVKSSLSDDYASNLEDSFLGACTTFGLAAFIWGYEYCLTMLGAADRAQERRTP